MLGHAPIAAVPLARASANLLIVRAVKVLASILGGRASQSIERH